MAFALVEAPTMPGYKIPERYVPVLPTKLYNNLNVVFMKRGANATGHPRLNSGQKLILQFGELNRKVEIERKFAKGQGGSSYEYKLSLDCGSKKNHVSSTTESIIRFWYISKDTPLERFVRTVRREGDVQVIETAKIQIDKPDEEEKNLLTILQKTRITQ